MHIPLDKLKAVKKIITHDKCPDGLASALILKDALPGVPIVYLQYGTQAHLDLVAEDGMLFCDFSPPEARAQEFVDKGAIVLDHHKSAQSVVALFGENGAYADEVNDPGVSGALLAFEHVWMRFYEDTFEPFKTFTWARFEAAKVGNPNADYPTIVEESHALFTSDRVTAMKRFATLAGIRDTWQKNSPDWTEACAQAEALMFFPQASWSGVSILGPTIEQRMSFGPILLQKKAESVQTAIQSAYRNTLSGKKIAIIQGVWLTSDVREAMANTVDLLVGFHYQTDQQADIQGWSDGSIPDAPGPTMVLSCRSNDNFDAAAFCTWVKNNGGISGGGHTKAAGTSVRVKTTDKSPYLVIEGLITQYLASLG